MRQEYFNFQLPRILRSLKECADEIDMGTQYHLARYAYLFETTVLNDGATLVPTGGIEDGVDFCLSRLTWTDVDHRTWPEAHHGVH